MLRHYLEKNVSLTISLDGHSDKQHDQLRGKGVFNKVVKNIELFGRSWCKSFLNIHY